jgi:FKBP-type peptidyl-prolyl cis-trans isomerase FkpA
MKRNIIVFIMMVVPLMVMNCAKSTGSKNPGKELTLETDRQKSSYAVGYRYGTTVRAIADEVELDIASQGFKDAMLGKPKIPETELRQVYSKFQKMLEEKYKRKLIALAEKSKIDGERFLKENAGKEGIIVTKTGLQYKVLKEGAGPIPKETDIVTVHYRGTLIDGKEIINTYTKGQPAKLPLRSSIPAWKEGFQLMKVGSKYNFFIPPDLAYGEDGYQPFIGPNALLIYEVELLGIVPPYTPKPPTKKEN